jgi:rhodanese-related sulfurtransferase
MVGTVNPTQLVELMSRHDVDLVDVRDPGEWEMGHVPGARLVPLDVLRRDPDLVLQHGRTLVFICAKGVRSMAAAKLAERFGYERVYNVEGGTKEWARQGLELEVRSQIAA